ncbi:Cyclin-A1-1 [Vitis vinifera]|uniref:Cyclin-A1-1 n=1 Tax=Vitis vinifera TaxID=29760 RepID=A0A438K3W6_VITVI|nr:Cyclin-A1-1 [Vitis vinifera]
MFTIKLYPCSNFWGKKVNQGSYLKAPCTAKTFKIKKRSLTCIRGTSLSQNTFPASLNVKSSPAVSCEDTCFPKSDQPVGSLSASSSMVSVLSAPRTMGVSPSRSDGSVSLDETMSTCDSLKCPEFEYINNHDASPVSFVETKTGNICKGDVEVETIDKIVNVDKNFLDPRFYATIDCDIYSNLRASEVAEEYRLAPDTLFLTVNYIDRYLSGNVMNRKQLQLLGIACMMIAAKYEEICALQVAEFCYITDNTYSKEEVLQMESAVLNYLKFEMTVPTTKCFLRQFIHAAQGNNKDPSLQLECLASYLTELSLLEYNMLCYAPSLIAASATFLARFILFSAEKPWNSMLGHYTHYLPSHLHDCVKALHHLCCNNHGSGLPAIKEKYSQHKYKFVAKKYCPPCVPPEFFEDPSD